MIPAEDALQLAAWRMAQPEPESPALTEKETAALNYIDSQIESSVHRLFDGGVFDAMIPSSIATSKNIITALKRRYEDGRWLVTVKPIQDATGQQMFHVMFAPKQIAAAPDKSDELPVVIQSSSIITVCADRRVLVRMPTRERWPQALRVLDAYRGMAGMAIEMEVVVDYDDTSLTSEVLYRLSALGCTVTYGKHRSKVEACNGGLIDDWDILVLASDDMVPVRDGWAKRVVELFDEVWPHLDGALHFSDGAQGESLCTLPIMGKRLWQHFGYVYHGNYKSLFCDREYTDVLRVMRRLVYVHEVLIEHRHPQTGKATTDALYVKNDALWEADKATYEARSRSPHATPLLSVLICSLPARRAMCERLYAFLYSQVRREARMHFTNFVEIFVDDKPGISRDDKPGISRGAKRQRLLERARGQYVCFVDDDDWVAPNYIERIVTGLTDHPGADCAAFVGVMTTDGNNPVRFEHSLLYERWEQVNGVHVRPPNHLNPVRRVLALETGFRDLDHGEDKDFSDRLRPRLRKEVPTGNVPLYFYWKRS